MAENHEYEEADNVSILGPHGHSIIIRMLSIEGVHDWNVLTS